MGSLSIVLVLLGVFLAVAVGSVGESMLQLKSSENSLKSYQVLLDANVVFKRAVQDITIGSSSYPWGAVPTNTVLFNGIPVAALDSNSLTTFSVVQVGAKSFSIQKTWALSSEVSGTYHAGCVKGCDTATGVQEWVVRSLAVSRDFSQKKIAVVLVKKGKAIWDSESGGGAGDFDDPISYHVNGRHSLEGFEVTDLNGDGHPDMFYYSLETDGITGHRIVRLGAGDGTFGAEIDTVETRPTHFVLKDINGDGIKDMIGAFSGSMGVRLGVGDGTFGAQASYPNTGTLTEVFPGFSVMMPSMAANVYVQVADMNNDGFLDIVAQQMFESSSNPNHKIAIRLNNGDGTFMAPTEYLTNHKGMCSGVCSNVGGTFQIGDFNKDGNMDVMDVGVDDGGVFKTLFMNGTGSGVISAPGTALGASGGWEAKSADLNGDGNLDLISQLGTTITIKSGDGSGGFTSSTITTGNSAYAFIGPEVADLDGDGNMDIIALDDAVDQLSIHYGEGGGTFKPKSSMPSVQYPGEIEVADVNGDGAADIIVKTKTASQYWIHVYLQRGGGYSSKVIKVATLDY